ncbi:MULTISPECIES: bifunctional methylenetetrahydrofolate dehydrogenase/methenyltetrahydrofolate cyclohydrolase FolD [Fusobacterium]|uniref:bifunctional methylenetetrahydrofolate dehydrogenase/methenyltetrahydrofolate cyclohydrolase FolD n=1 Tax=Fusobacterium TaxID=848 RepID=UPI0014774CE1|nr:MULTISPECIES: bifunctional methylenetetrahydrofolate dehydrogenase/methenyltetrahydrofolate cyclohydrolase FolD [Fusobacterium]NME36109.1 bifunctional methylenetetrahydrofolate dehydrogenase/methenyltetrahydrofolate cyclohydrolase FolD [Fusobacterium sp. FSA-380-WT-3A]
MNILDGKKYSEKILNNIKLQIEKLESLGKRKPGLAVIMVGENPASKIYVNSKVKACEKVGIYSEKITLPEDITQEGLLEEIEKLNNNKNIDGILVQLPLPKHLEEEKICNAIATEKDVDGFKAENLGKIVLGKEDGLVPCTPQGIMYLLDTIENINLYGMNAVVIGRSNIVGKPIAALLINRGATTIVCNSKTKNIEELLKNADIIVAALGKAKFVTENMVKEGAIVIDVGINRIDGKLYGDVDFENVSKKTSYITPVPGGVGPMTIAMLLNNTIKAYKGEEV